METLYWFLCVDVLFLSILSMDILTISYLFMVSAILC